MNKTGIDYLTHSWNPLAMRCTPVSPACANCWHLAMADRLAANPALPVHVRAAYENKFPRFPPVLIEKRLDEPLRLKKLATIGVQFMGDLFHDNVTYSAIRRIWAVMGGTDHTYLVLTKRAERMFRVLQTMQGWSPGDCGTGILPNVWLGVTAEDQQRADERIPLLLQTPAAVRFVSIEPMLEPIDLQGPLNGYPEQTSERAYVSHDMALDAETPEMEGMMLSDDEWEQTMPRLDWVIVGCESGPNRRQYGPGWMIDLVRQCKAAAVPVFCKQININGRVSHDMNEWPEELRIREYPNAIQRP